MSLWEDFFTGPCNHGLDCFGVDGVLEKANRAIAKGGIETTREKPAKEGVGREKFFGGVKGDVVRFGPDHLIFGLDKQKCVRGPIANIGKPHFFARFKEGALAGKGLIGGKAIPLGISLGLISERVDRNQRLGEFDIVFAVPGFILFEGFVEGILFDVGQ